MSSRQSRRALLLVALVSIFSVAAKVLMGPYAFVPWLDEGVGVPPLQAINAATIRGGLSPWWTESMLGGYAALLYPGQLNALLLPYLVLPGWAAYGAVLFGSRLLGGWFCYRLGRDRMGMEEIPALTFAALFILASPLHGHSEVVATFTGLTHFAIPAVLWALTACGDRGIIRHVVAMGMVGLAYGLSTSSLSYSYNVLVLLALWPLFFPSGSLRIYLAGLSAFSAAAALCSLPLLLATAALGSDSPSHMRMAGISEWSSVAAAVATLGRIVADRPIDVLLFGTLPVLALVFSWRHLPQVWLRSLLLAVLFLLTDPIYSFLLHHGATVLPLLGRLRPRGEVPTIFILVLLSAVSLQVLHRVHRDVSLVVLGAFAALVLLGIAQINLNDFKRALAGDNWTNLYRHPDLTRLSRALGAAPGSRVEMVGVFMRSRLGLRRMPEYSHPLFLGIYGLASLGGTSPVMSRRIENYWRLMTGIGPERQLADLVLDGGSVEIDAHGECSSELPPLDISRLIHDEDLLRLAGVAHLVSPRPLSGPGWRLINTESAGRMQSEICRSTSERLRRMQAGEPGYSPLFIYESEQPVAPRAFLAGAVRVVPDRQAAFAALAEERHRTGRRLAIVEAPSGVSIPDACPSGEVGIRDARAGRFEFETDVSKACALVVSSSFDRGWRAAIDDISTPVFPANLAFLVIPIPPGRHRITLRHGPI